MSKLPVGKKPMGRPPAFDGGTQQVKLPTDLVLMVSWLARVERKTAAQIIDPLTRPTVSERYARRYGDIRAIKAAEDAAAEGSAQAPGPPLPLPIHIPDVTFARLSEAGKLPDGTSVASVMAATRKEFGDNFQDAEGNFDEARFEQFQAVSQARLLEHLAKVEEFFLRKGAQLARNNPPSVEFVEAISTPTRSPPDEAVVIQSGTEAEREVFAVFGEDFYEISEEALEERMNALTPENAMRVGPAILAEISQADEDLKKVLESRAKLIERGKKLMNQYPPVGEDPAQSAPSGRPTETTAKTAKRERRPKKKPRKGA